MVDISKLNEDTKLLKDERNKEKVAEMIQMLGHNPEIILAADNEKNEAIIDKAKKLVAEIAETKLFEQDENNHYKVEAKVTAITIMTASIGIKEDYGIIGKQEPTPYFSAVSDWLDVPSTTLQKWWKARNTIMREQVALGYSAIQKSTFRQIQLIEKFTDALDLTQDEMKKLKETPKGIAVMLAIITKLSFNAKMLNTQGGLLIDNATKDDDKGTGSNVSVIMPKPITTTTLPPDTKGKKDVSDITDQE